MAESTKKRKKSYAALLNELGEALLCRGALADELSEYIQRRKEQKAVARHEKFGSRERYLAWAQYYEIRATIVEIRNDIKSNSCEITRLEDEISTCRPRANGADDNPDAADPDPDAMPDGF